MEGKGSTDSTAPNAAPNIVTNVAPNAALNVVSTSSKGQKVMVTDSKLESYEDKFRELRATYLSVLELGMRRDELDVVEAFRAFRRATLMQPEAAYTYVITLGTTKLWEAAAILLK